MPARVIARRVRQARSSGDTGITLIELIVAMALNVIIGALTVGIFIDVNDSSDTSIDRTVNTATARNTMQDWTALLRVADGKTTGSKVNRIEWLTAKDMLFYADLNNRSITNLGVTGAPTMIWLRLDSTGTLIEEHFASTATAGTAPTQCLRMATGVTPVSSAPIFTAYDRSGAAMTAPMDLGTAPAPSAGCRALPVTLPSQASKPDLAAQANLQKVVIVQIDFEIWDTARTHSLEFKSQAVLPALGGL